MATDASLYPTQDAREQAARIDQILADIEQKLALSAKVREETTKVRQDVRLAPRALIFTALGAGAALFAAGATFTKLFIG